MRHPAPALCALLAGALALAACSTPFEVELPDEPPRLVVRSLFQADSLLTLDLGQSAAVLAPGGTPFETVRGATVTIFQDGAPVGQATFDEFRNRYVSDIRVRAGRTYGVRVEAPGFETAEAEDTVPLPRPFEVDVERGPDLGRDRDRIDAVTVRFSDPEGPDYYALYGLSEQRFPAFPDATPRTGPLTFRSADPVLADGALYGLIGDVGDPFYLRAFFSDRALPASTAAIRVSVGRYEDESGSAEVTDRLRLAVVSKTYYRYQRAIAEANPTDLDLFDSPTRVPSNVEGGYGIFAGFAATERVLPG